MCRHTETVKRVLSHAWACIIIWYFKLHPHNIYTPHHGQLFTHCSQLLDKTGVKLGQTNLFVTCRVSKTMETGPQLATFLLAISPVAVPVAIDDIVAVTSSLSMVPTASTHTEVITSPSP